MTRPCSVYRDACPIHGFVHGAEAEELRQGIEEIMLHVEDDQVHRELSRLLDKVDARDSLAYLENTVRPQVVDGDKVEVLDNVTGHWLPAAFVNNAGMVAFSVGLRTLERADYGKTWRWPRQRG